MTNFTFLIDYNNCILNKYLKIILNAQFQNHSVNNSGYRFRCNVCGDSAISLKKKRAWILFDYDPWLFYCFNCGYQMPAKGWLKKYFPDTYRDYIKELMSINRKEKDTLIYNKLHELPIVKHKNITNVVRPSTDYSDMQFFKHIDSAHTYFFQKARCICETRKIPYSVWSKWYVSVDGKYKNRLIIPFYDNMGGVYYFQARALFNSQNKYLNMDENKDEAIYNYYNIDKQQPVTVLEGPIDSLFIENSIAVLGTKFSPVIENKLNQLQCYYLLDCDKAGKDKSYELLKKQQYVFMWKKFIKKYNLPSRIKWDINDVIIYLDKDKFSFSDLQPYFTNNILHQMWI